MITCIVLSAGLSERFGFPKALAGLGNSPVIAHIQSTLLKTGCDEIIVVLGANAKEIEPSIFIHSRIKVVYNKNYYLGQTSSVQAGWQKAHSSSKAVLLLPVDCPLVRASTIDKLTEQFVLKNPDILIPTYQNKKGHPPAFHHRLKNKVLALPDNVGINSLFTEFPPQTIEIDDPGIVKSFNTKEEFAEFTKGTDQVP